MGRRIKILNKKIFPLIITIGLFCMINIAERKSGIIIAQTDTTAPSTTYSLSPASPNGDNGWYVSPVQIQLDATDLETGVKTIYYRVNNGSWKSQNFAGTQNQIANASFELTGSTSTGASGWETTLEDPEAAYSHSLTDSAPGFGDKSVYIEATGGAWHGIHNKNNLITVLPYDNMTASVWLKTENATGGAKFKIYSANYDEGSYIYSLIDESNTLVGTNDWTKVALDFTVSDPNADAVYIDVGIIGPGNLWIDAVSLSTASQNSTATFAVSSDNSNHQVEYYAVDYAGNQENSSCVSPKNNCIEFKIDQTPPGNWSNIGSERRSGNAHQLYVFTDVFDETSGLKTSGGNVNKYQYTTHKFPEFGYYSDLNRCRNRDWESGGWVDLGEGVDSDGDNSAYLETQRTEFCNSNWKVCKDVRFYAEDMAGNSDTKQWCLKGPWVQVVGEGIVRSNNNIDMGGEGNGENTDGLIELGGYAADAFTTTKGWKAANLQKQNTPDYDELINMTTKEKIELAETLSTSSEVFEHSGDFEIDSGNIPGNYSNEVFDQIVFVDGDLLISSNIEIGSNSTALFIVSGDVQIDKDVEYVGIAILADGDLETAYNFDPDTEQVNTLTMQGIFVANTIIFQRTLENNEDNPAEYIIFEPKYALQQKNFFEISSIEWSTKN